ncbi:hypothetical protein Q604_UNBC12893G0001, partial [human gut metagenome]
MSLGLIESLLGALQTLSLNSIGLTSVLGDHMLGLS